MEVRGILKKIFSRLENIKIFFYIYRFEYKCTLINFDYDENATFPFHSIGNYLFPLSCFLSLCTKQLHRTFPFATRAEAQMLITDIDDYTRNWNQFDINSRLQTTEGKKSQLLTLAMNATRNWSDKDKEKINRAIKAIQAQIKKQKFTRPSPMKSYW